MNVDQPGVDPLCRFARLAARDPERIFHICQRRDGRLVRPLVDDCAAEARTQFLELRPQPPRWRA